MPKVPTVRMNHINLAVPDVPASRAFFETYFGLRCLAAPQPEQIVVMGDDAECIVTLSNFNKAAAVSYPSGFHIGFNQPSREAVDAVRARLEADGVAVGKTNDFHGAWTFYFKAPGGIPVEVFHQYETFGA